MNKKEYKRKVAELFSFKSPNSKKRKESLAQSDKISPDKQPTRSDAEGEMEENKMASSAVKLINDKAQSDKKRDVIVIGAGLSGKFK